MARSPTRTRQNCSRSSYALLRLQLKNFYKFLQKEFTWNPEHQLPHNWSRLLSHLDPRGHQRPCLAQVANHVAWPVAGSHAAATPYVDHSWSFSTCRTPTCNLERQLHQGQCPEGLPPPSTPARTLAIVCQTTATCARHFWRCSLGCWRCWGPLCQRAPRLCQGGPDHRDQRQARSWKGTSCGWSTTCPSSLTSPWICNGSHVQHTTTSWGPLALAWPRSLEDLLQQYYAGWQSKATEAHWWAGEQTQGWSYCLTAGTAGRQWQHIIIIIWQPHHPAGSWHGWTAGTSATLPNHTEPGSLKPEPDLRPKMTSCSSFKVSLINSSQTWQLSEVKSTP